MASTGPTMGMYGTARVGGTTLRNSGKGRRPFGALQTLTRLVRVRFRVRFRFSIRFRFRFRFRFGFRVRFRFRVSVSVRDRVSVRVTVRVSVRAVRIGGRVRVAEHGGHGTTYTYIHTYIHTYSR